MDEFVGYVYKTTNLINNMIYIGKHHQHLFNKKYYGSGTKIKQMLKLYGKKNFIVEVIEYCQLQEELNEKEIYYINIFNSTNPEIGYNMIVCSHGKKFKKIEQDDALNNTDNILNTNITYTSIFEKEMLKIIYYDENYVLLSNGNNIQLKDFKNFYKPRKIKSKNDKS